MQKEEKLIPISEYAKTYITRRGFQADVSYIYKLIKKHQAGLKKNIPFRYKHVDKRIFIVDETK